MGTQGQPLWELAALLCPHQPGTGSIFFIEKDQSMSERLQHRKLNMHCVVPNKSVVKNTTTFSTSSLQLTLHLS
jgi:hypothetical protein